MSTAQTVERVAGSDGKSYPASYSAHRDAIRKAIEADPAATTTAIAKRMNSSRDTVIAVRKQMAGQAITTRYDSMCRAIAECAAVDEVKDMRDKAMALEVYARQAQNFEAERTATEIRVRAEKQCGRLLNKTPKNKGIAGGGERNSSGHVVVPVDETKKLSELGITKNQSSQWQQLADVPDEVFEAAIRDQQTPLSAASIIERHKPPPAPDLRAAINKVPAASLWVWGRLRDFERDKPDTPPRDLFQAMTEPMQADVVRLAPAFIAFLSQMIEGADHE